MGWKNCTRRLVRKRNTGQGDRTGVSVEAERNPFEDLPCRAHPGAQCSRVGRGLVMGMVRCVGHRLGIHQPAEEEETDSQADCDGSPERMVHHQHWVDSSQDGCWLSRHHMVPGFAIDYNPNSCILTWIPRNMSVV